MLSEKELQKKTVKLHRLLQEHLPEETYKEEAKRAKNAKKIEKLLKRLSDEEKKQLVDAKDIYGNTILYWARNPGGAKVLIQHGADVNVKNIYGTTPLDMLVENESVVKVLIQHGADVNAKTIKGRTPLHTAVIFNSSRSVALLIQHGADVNAKNIYGNTPLHTAVKSYNLESIELLMQHGADVNAKNIKDRTPLHFAVNSQFQPIQKINLLLNEGAELSAKSVLLRRINRWIETGKLPGVKLAEHPQKPGVLYNENARVKPWERENIMHEQEIEKRKKAKEEKLEETKMPKQKAERTPFSNKEKMQAAPAIEQEIEKRKKPERKKLKEPDEKTSLLMKNSKRNYSYVELEEQRSSLEEAPAPQSLAIRIRNRLHPGKQR